MNTLRILILIPMAIFLWFAVPCIIYMMFIDLKKTIKESRK